MLYLRENPLLREIFPDLKIRFINVVDLFRLQPETDHPHGLSDRVPRLTVAGAHVKERFKNEQIGCCHCAHENDIDKPEIVQWKWPGPQGTVT
jgi:phosphoketolase